MTRIAGGRANCPPSVRDAVEAQAASERRLRRTSPAERCSCASVGRRTLRPRVSATRSEGPFALHGGLLHRRKRPNSLFEQGLDGIRRPDQPFGTRLATVDPGCPKNGPQPEESG